MYNIIRKHSEDANWHIVGTARTAAQARKMIQKMVEDENDLITTSHETRTLGDVTNTTFSTTFGLGMARWSIAYWFQEAE